MILSILSRHKNVVVGLGTFAVAFYVAGVTEPLHSSETSEIAVKRVEVAAVTAASNHRDLRFSGVTRAVQRARLAFSLGGRVVARPVEVGDTVQKGRELARLDRLEVENAVAGARGTLAELAARRSQAERDLKRAEQLLEAKAATSEEVEKTRAGLAAVVAAEESASARLRETERLLDETTIRAPFSGTVTEVFFEPGEFASPGRPVVTLSGDGDVEVEVEVPESVVPRIAKGDEVRVEAPRLGTAAFPARVESVGRTAAGPGSLFPVVVRIPGSRGVPAGATAELVLSLANDRAMAVPVEAVVNPGGRRPAVFRIVDGAGAGKGSGQVSATQVSSTQVSVEKVFVEVGSLIGETVVVRGDLAVGDRVVVGGQRGLLDGETVETVGGTR